jgi:hypothetical protein
MDDEALGDLERCLAERCAHQDAMREELRALNREQVRILSRLDALVARVCQDR